MANVNHSIFEFVWLLKKTRTYLKDANRFRPQAQQIFQNKVQLCGQHRPKAFIFTQPTNVWCQWVFVVNPHIGKQTFG